jgi:SAM-dependent methyltransferase
MALKDYLVHPLTRDLQLDDPGLISLRAKIVKQKGFLTRVYRQWYQIMLCALPVNARPVVELGTGPGFMKELLPELITSDLIPGGAFTLILNGVDLPFRPGSLGSIVMVDVLHHIQNPRAFFASASRCVDKGGCIIMIEPWNTPWSRWVYTHLHHEKFDPADQDWELASSKPLSEANGAFPWILFSRDRDLFSKEFPAWTIDRLQPIMPLLYLLSGGFTTFISPPAWSYPAFQAFEKILSPLNPLIAMFALIRLRHI